MSIFSPTNMLIMFAKLSAKNERKKYFYNNNENVSQLAFILY